jgi:peptide/nickel transport system substrate-binding protein
MRNSPLKSLLRAILIFLFFVLLGWLLWSNVLLEERVYHISKQVDRIEKEIAQKGKGSSSFPQKKIERTLIDNSYLNLLTTDPFMEVTLPKILGVEFKPHGIKRAAILGKPHNLHPLSDWSEVAGWTALCVPSLATLHVGKFETYAPNLALKMEERINTKNGMVEFWVYLRDDLYWHPLNLDHFAELSLDPFFLKSHQVTADDFLFYYNVVNNPYVEEMGAASRRVYLEDIEEIEVIDPLTFVVRWKMHEVEENGKIEKRIRYTAKQITAYLSPLPSFVFQYFSDGSKILEGESSPSVYRTDSTFAQQFNTHFARNVIIGCGPWIFEGMTEKGISFKRNEGYFNPLAALFDEMHIAFKSSPETMWQSFKIQEIDTYSLNFDQEAEFQNFLNSPLYHKQKEAGNAILRLDYLQRSYYYIGWSENTPFFKNAKVRQAMTLAMDRKRIIQTILDGRGEELTGPFSQESPSYDTKIKPWPFDPEWAARILKEEGFEDVDQDGILEKEVDGVRIPFSFTITYYVKNSISKSIAEFIAMSLKKLKVHAVLNGVDIADLSRVFDDKNFDSVYMGWNAGVPPEDPTQLWDSKGADIPGSSNAIGFKNTIADGIIKQLQYETDKEERIKLYHAFHELIHSQAPYTFLYSPKIAFLYRENLKNVFIPLERQDLIPGADMTEPISEIFYFDKG